MLGLDGVTVVEVAAGAQHTLVLGACGGRRTCMELALHAAHGAAGAHLALLQQLLDAMAELPELVHRGAPTAQRFYPQCAPCSQKQSAAVRALAGRSVLHLPTVRPFHLTGFVSAPLARAAAPLARVGLSLQPPAAPAAAPEAAAALRLCSGGGGLASAPCSRASKS